VPSKILAHSLSQEEIPENFKFAVRPAKFLRILSRQEKIPENVKLAHFVVGAYPRFLISIFPLSP